jgi:FAD:protein FMN transferase
MNTLLGNPGMTFTREAMAAVFRLTLVEPDGVYARQAADAALAELEQIENRLSRFVETGDLFRIRRLGRGQTTVVHVDTFQCLRIALEVQAATGGAFDPAYESKDLSIGGPSIELIEAGCMVRTLADGVRLDLGGIGKGFALDRMAALLKDWDIGAALLCADSSTVLATGAPPGRRGWPIRIETEDAPMPLELVHRAISASGTAVRGNHIIDPRTGRPAAEKTRIWSLAPTAAEADALSTAFFVMTDDEVRDSCRRRPKISALFLQPPSVRMSPLPPGEG